MQILQRFNPAKPTNIIGLTIIVVVWVNFNMVRWQKKDVIDHDVAFYYSYLPSVFYHHDISQQFLNRPENNHLIALFEYPPKAPNGNYVFKSTMGMSITYLPFFIAAHYYAKIVGEPLDGYSEPFQFAIQFSSLFYFVMGLFFLIRLLRSYFPDSIISLSLSILVFGTNALYYLIFGAGMSHAVDFFLVSSFLYCSIQWHKQGSLKNSFFIGIIGGLLTLIRPINILIFLFFLLYDIKNVSDFKSKIKLFLNSKLSIALILLFAFLMVLPQLMYWKYQTGSYFFNSYVGEHFFFNRPQIINGLFSFRKGWLIYTPIMMFALIGFYHLKKLHREYFYATVFLFLIYIYVAFSWWCWWYGGSYGQRSLIDIYPILALPLTSFLFSIQQSDVIKKKIIHSIITLLIVLNLHQTFQAHWNNIHYDSMTRDAYFDTFFRFSKNPEAEKYLKHPDVEKAKAGLDEY